jgi:hypothetical protein
VRERRGNGEWVLLGTCPFTRSSPQSPIIH